MTCRWKVVVLLLAALVILLSIFWIFNSRPRGARLADGTSIVWLGVSVGTNSFKYGSPLENLLGDRIPAQGLDLASFHLSRPLMVGGIDNADATAWLVLRDTDPARAPRATFYWEGSAVVVSNRSGRSISIPTARPYRTTSNEMLMRIPLLAFPRDAKSVILRISPPFDTRTGREWFEFEFRNPFPGPHPAWNGAALPVTNSGAGFEFALTEVQASPLDSTQLTFRVPNKDWTVAEASIVDSEGNVTSWSRSQHPREESPYAYVWFDHGLETNRAWRINATFVRSAGWPRAGSEFPEEERRALTVSRGSEGALATNSTGDVFLWKLEGNQLQLIRQNGSSRPHWVVLSATNENSKAVEIPGGNSWTRRRNGAAETQVWHVPVAADQLQLQVACPREAQVEFLVAPR